MNEWTGWSDEVNQVVCEPFLSVLMTRLPVGSSLTRSRPQSWMSIFLPGLLATSDTVICPDHSGHKLTALNRDQLINAHFAFGRVFSRRQ